jgi:hypothetical protein
LLAAFGKAPPIATYPSLAQDESVQSEAQTILKP